MTDIPATPEAERAYWSTHTADVDVWGAEEVRWDHGVADALAEITRSGVNVRGADVLELAYGPGRLTEPVAGLARTVVAVDIAAEMLYLASDRLTAAGRRNVTLVQGDGRTVPCRDESFDAGYAVLLFQHLPADAVAGYLREVRRVLRPGGRFMAQHVDIGHAPGFLSYSYTVAELDGLAVGSGLVRHATSPAGDKPWGWRWTSWEKKP